MSDMWSKISAGAKDAGRRASVAAEKTKLQAEIQILQSKVTGAKKAPRPRPRENVRRRKVRLRGARLPRSQPRAPAAEPAARARRAGPATDGFAQAMGVQIYDALSLGDQGEISRVFGQFKAQIDALEAQIKEKSDRIEVLDYR